MWYSEYERQTYGCVWSQVELDLNPELNIYHCIALGWCLHIFMPQILYLQNRGQNTYPESCKNSGCFL